MRLIVDCRTHVFPRVLPSGLGRILNPIQPLIHSLPASMRILEIPRLLVESEAERLDIEMRSNRVAFSFVIAHPPFVPNALVLKAAHRFSGMIPAVSIPTTESNPDRALESLLENGGRILKIRADESQIDAQHFQRLLSVADEQKIPVILEPNKKPLFRKQHHFEPWFRRFPKLKFLLTRPSPELCKKYGNVWMDTSWQSAKQITQAVKVCGASKILFASDWPLGQENMSLGISRILEAERFGMISSIEADRILGKNALELLGLSPLWKPRPRAPRNQKSSSSSSSSSSTSRTS